MKQSEVTSARGTFWIYEFAPQTLNSSQSALFFSHANGIPALTYRTFFEKLALELKVHVVAYDMRGIGKTQATPIFFDPKDPAWVWELLALDHLAIFAEIKKEKEHFQWTFAGHSLGAWISLLSAYRVHISKIYLFDPPILTLSTAFSWAFLHLTKQTHLNPLGQKVRKRKTQFLTYTDLFQNFKKASLTKNWSNSMIENYIEGCFIQKKGGYFLRHDPLWEAHLFEQYPKTATSGFLKIPAKVRASLNTIFFIGSKSDACDPKTYRWVKLFFPKAKWQLVQDGGHMFPLEIPDLLLSLIKNNS